MLCTALHGHHLLLPSLAAAIAAACCLGRLLLGRLLPQLLGDLHTH